MQKTILLFLLCLLVGTSAYADFMGPFLPGETGPVLLKLRVSRPDTVRANLLIRLSDLYFYRANRSAADLDSALYYTNAAHKLAASLAYEKGRAEICFQQGALFPLKNLRQRGLHATEAAIKLFSKQKNYRMLGEAYFRLAGYYSLAETEIGQRIKYTRSSLEAFQAAKLPIKAGAVLQMLGDLHSTRGENAAALSYLKQSLQAYQSAKYNKLMGVYDLLGTVYTSLGATDEGIKYGILAVRNAQTAGDTSMQLSTIHNHLAITYYTLREYRKAIEHYNNSLSIAEKYGDVETIYLVSANKAYPYMKLGRYAEAASFLGDIERRYPVRDVSKKFWVYRAYISIYRELGQYNKATKYVHELLALIDQGIDPEQAELIYSHLIEFYFAKKEYGLAGKYLVLQKKIKVDNPRVVHRSHLWQARLDSANQQYRSALAEFQQYSVLKDAFYDENKSRQINQLEIIYETEKKEENIQALKKESVLHQQMLRQASLVQNITYVSLSLLLVIIGLLIYGYLLVKKNNKALAASQQEIHNKNISLGRLLSEKQWLMKEIHHRVKNNLHMIVGLLESQAEYLKGDEAKMALAESEHRIQSMSMIHQKLYQTENLTSIEISPYIHELVQYLKACFKSENQVEFKVDTDQAEMNISHAIPLGLILNEAIINSLKYAFPGKRPGRIDVILKQTGPGLFLLTISDNGIGLGADFDVDRVHSFGLTLILGLCQDLGAECKVITDGGTTIQIAFEYAAEPIHAEPYVQL